MAETQNTTVFFVNDRYNAEERRQLGNEIIEYIRQRTDRGEGVGAQDFGSYSENYQRTPEFEVAGKSPSPINLRLTGDMMDTLQVIDISVPGRIEIGFPDGTPENDRSVWVADKGYSFLGLADWELDDIVSAFGDPTTLETASANISQSIAQQLLRGLFGSE